MISIVTPNFNSSKYLIDTIESVINQTYLDWEWLIVDDASTDESCRIIKSLQDKRIKLIELKENSGPAVARNIGIKEAKGRYISFIDSDDVWDKDFLKSSLRFLSNNNFEVVFSSYKRKNEDFNVSFSNFVVPNRVNFNRILFNCPIFISTLVYDTNLIGKVYTANHYKGKREDYAMILDLIRKVPFAYGTKKPLVTYRIRKNSYSRNKLKMAIDQFKIYFEFLNFNFFKSTFYTICWAINGFFKYKGV